MPNHITNILDVTGPAESVERFRLAVSNKNPVLAERNRKAKLECIEENLAKLKLNPNDAYALSNLKDLRKEESLEKPIDFNGTVPMPVELENTVSSSSSTGETWYSWSIANWGTKWNAYSECEVKEIKGGIRYQFDTAWSPPTEWLEKTAVQFPDLTFVDYFKDEGGGSGILTLNGEKSSGEVIDDHDWYMMFDDEYICLNDYIMEADYDEIIKKYLETDELEYSSLQSTLLTRIKDQDLPLFVNFSWYGKASKAYTDRLKGVE